MKKMLVAILIFVFSVNSVYVVNADNIGNETSESYEANVDTKYEKLVEGIVGVDVFSSKVSRAEFVNVISKVFKLSADEYEPIYSDVLQNSEYANEIIAVYKSGWITKANKFEPERTITFNEALKIIIEALGYGFFADQKGGFPNGYISVADRIGILDGLKNRKNQLSESDGYRLLFNTLLSNMFIMAPLEKQTTDDSVLKIYHNTIYINGIVTKTYYNGYDGETHSEKDKIDIGGITYKCKFSSNEMLGKRYDAFVKDYDESQPEVISLAEDFKESHSLDMFDFETKENAVLKFYDNQKSKSVKYRIEDDCLLIHNGVRIIENYDTYFKKAPGNIKLFDNDGNGKYDVVYIYKYSYIHVSGIDKLNRIVSDKMNTDFSLDLSDDDCRYIIFDENDHVCEFLDIQVSDIYRVILSDDKKFCLMRKVSETLVGENLCSSEDSIEINGAEYIFSDYMIQNYAQHFNISVKYSFVVDGNILVVAEKSQESMKYGYLIKIFEDKGINNELKAKILNENGQILGYTVASNVKVDGESKKNNILHQILVGKENQILRFSLNTREEINKIDFCDSSSRNILFDNEKDEYNKLTEFKPDTSRGSLKYISSIQAFSMHFNIQGTRIFKIPNTNTADDKDFKIGSASDFIHDKKYDANSLRCYDINQNGSLGAMVYYYDPQSNDNIPATSTPYIIEKIHAGRNDGDDGYWLFMWGGGVYVKKFLPEDVAVDKSEDSSISNLMHKTLCKGDIVRINEDLQGNISCISVDFDGRPDKMVANSALDDIQYRSGKVYAKDSSFLAIVETSNLEEPVEYSVDNLSFYSFNTNNIVLYNAASGIVRPCSVDDIRTYISDYDNNDFVVINQRNYVPYLIVIYRGE